MEGLAEGRIVHFVMPDGVNHRGAMITQVFPQVETPNPMVNMTVFPDVLNDGYRYGAEWMNAIGVPKGSVHYSEEKSAGTWHWPERN
jgi:hypothetical protein